LRSKAPTRRSAACGVIVCPLSDAIRWTNTSASSNAGRSKRTTSQTPSRD
jgi:hypothetical protein